MLNAAVTQVALKTSTVVKVLTLVVTAAIVAGLAAMLVPPLLKETTYKTATVVCADGRTKTVTDKCHSASEWKKAAEAFCTSRSDNPPKRSRIVYKPSKVKKLSFSNPCKPISSPVSKPMSKPVSPSQPGVGVLFVVSSNLPTTAPLTTVQVGQTNVPLFAFTLQAEREPILVTSLQLTLDGVRTLQDLSNVRLYLGNTTSAFATPFQAFLTNTSTATYYFAIGRGGGAPESLLPDLVRPGSPVTILVKADIGNPGLVSVGDRFHFSIKDSSSLTAYGGTSQLRLSPLSIRGPLVRSPGDFVITPHQVTITGDAPAAGSTSVQYISVGSHLGRFKITNNGDATIAVNQLFLRDGGTHTGTSTRYVLKYSDQNSSNYTANIATSGAANLSFTIPNAVRIDGGSYRYFTIAIQQAGALTSGDSFQFFVEKIGDVLYQVLEVDLGYDGNLDGGIFGIIKGLPVNNKPILGTIVRS